MALLALGIVYGDIGTSPLYALRECFTSPGVRVEVESVLGVLSLIFWSLASIVSLKYLRYVLEADNKGEGGILALMALSLSRERASRQRGLILALGIAGAAFLYGDGAITPAISVLSAVEGLTLAAPHLEVLVVPATCLILVALFLLQRRGTGFMDQPDAVDLLRHSGLIRGLREVTFFLGQEHLIVSEQRGLRRSGMVLFSALSRIAQPANRFFNIPPARVMEVGIQIVL